MAKYCLRLLAAFIITTTTTHSFAAGGGSLRVRIFVESACKFINSNPIQMRFGSLTSGDRSISQTTQINCISGTPFKIHLSDGLHPNSNKQRQMKHESEAAWLPYGLSVNPKFGSGTGQNINVTLTATVSENDYQNRPVGQYNDIVVLTINP